MSRRARLIDLIRFNEIVESDAEDEREQVIVKV